MTKNLIIEYYVEGEDEKKLIEVLKTDMQIIKPGKVRVLNVVSERITAARLMSLKPNSAVVLVFDTDVGDTTILEENIKALCKCTSVVDVITIPQVKKLEDELVKSCNIKDVKQFFDSQGIKKFKSDFIKEKNLKKKLLDKGFDINKLWSSKPTGKFASITNQADKIKKQSLTI